VGDDGEEEEGEEDFALWSQGERKTAFDTNC